MRLRLLQPALNEIRSITSHYERQRQGLGEEFTDSLAVTLTEIENHPARFAKVVDVQSVRDYRGITLDRFPYNVMDEIRQDEAVVVAIAHLSRRSGYWKRRR